MDFIISTPGLDFTQANATSSAPQSWWARLFGSSKSTALKSASSKKRLVRSRLDSMLLLLPFMLWAALIIVIYPISYASLATLDTPVSMVNMANYLSELCTALSVFNLKSSHYGKE